MKYTPGIDGHFAGQLGYGYRSIEVFVDAVIAIRSGLSHPDDFRSVLATAKDTSIVTAILEAGRRSLDTGTIQQIKYDEDGLPCDLFSSLTPG